MKKTTKLISLLLTVVMVTAMLVVVPISADAAVAAKSIKLNYSSLTMTKGTKFTLKATVSPSNTSNKTVYWSSSNPKVAGMASGGVVNAKAVGTCTITAKTSNGKKATCKITVKAPGNPTGISLNYFDLTMTQGTKFTLKAKITPSVVKNNTVYWSSSDPKVASVASGGVITAKSMGYATISARTCNGKEAYCFICVKAKPDKYTKNYEKVEKFVDNKIKSKSDKYIHVKEGNTEMLISTHDYAGVHVSYYDKVGTKKEYSTRFTINTTYHKDVEVSTFYGYDSSGAWESYWEDFGTITIKTYNGSNGTFYNHASDSRKQLNKALNAFSKYIKKNLNLTVQDIGFIKFPK